MWVATVDGFFSIVQKDPTARGNLCVRARVKKDLERMLAVIGRSDIPITSGVGTDYEFRAFLPREEVAGYLADVGFGIEYANFKAKVGSVRKGGDPVRLEVYHDCWRSLTRLAGGAR